MFGKEPLKGVNPDEVVAIGAAIQAGVLAGEVKDVLLLDVIPLTLSIETLGGVATPLIERNTTIPSKKSQVFSTASDNQTQVEINVVQGERPMVADNKSLGKFILDGLPPALRGVPQIEVTFDVDANGILNVAAKDQATGRDQSMRIMPDSGLNEEEIQRMVDEAKQFKEADSKRKAEIEIRNNAENLAHTAEKTLSEHGEQLDDSLKSELETKIAAVKTALEGSDTDAVGQAADALSQTLQQAGGQMHQQPQADPDAASDATDDPSESKNSPDEDVIEGQFEEA